MIEFCLKALLVTTTCVSVVAWSFIGFFLVVEAPAAIGAWRTQRRSRRDSARLKIPNGVFQPTPTSCFRACVATVLGIPISDVPAACDGETWDWSAFQRWLGSRGLRAIEVGFENGGTLYSVETPVPCIVTGPSPRPCKTGRHAVVGELVGVDGFRLLHDPHPARLWLAGEPTHATFFVPCQALTP